MSDPSLCPSPRPSYYVTAADAVHYARRYYYVLSARGWTQVMMEENLPGWTLKEFTQLLRRRRVLSYREPGGWSWRSPEVVGVVIEGDTVIRDKGDLVHPAKAAARRRIPTGPTSQFVRVLYGDASNAVVHVRCSAATDDERRLHRAARDMYLAAADRPTLVLNMNSSLVDPFDAPEQEAEMAEWYQDDVADLLRMFRDHGGSVRLFTLAVHDDGDEIVVERGGKETLPEPLRSDRQGISSRVVSLRADTLYGPRRANTVAGLLRLVSSKR